MGFTFVFAFVHAGFVESVWPCSVRVGASCFVTLVFIATDTSTINVPYMSSVSTVRCSTRVISMYFLISSMNCCSNSGTMADIACFPGRPPKRRAPQSGDCALTPAEIIGAPTDAVTKGTQRVFSVFLSLSLSLSLSVSLSPWDETLTDFDLKVLVCSVTNHKALNHSSMMQNEKKNTPTKHDSQTVTRFHPSPKGSS